MLQIVPRMDDPDQIVLVAQGRIAGAALNLLANEVACHKQSHRPLVLDLDGVRFIDRDGTRLLRCWMADGLILRGGSLFLRLLLHKRGVQTD
jgi:anti-anti-sigma regulatory factor